MSSYKYFATLSLSTLIACAHAATNDENCLAVAIYKEANTESLIGQRAVLDVIETRMHQNGATACHVIHERGQFSWLRSNRRLVATHSQLLRLKKLQNMSHVAENATNFYVARMHKRPKWAKRLRNVKHIGRHIFGELR